MFAQVGGQQRAFGGARPCEQAHYQGYHCRVDVVDALEVEQDGLRVGAIGLGVGGVQGLLGEAVDLTAKVDHGFAKLEVRCLGVECRRPTPLVGDLNGEVSV